MKNKFFSYTTILNLLAALVLTSCYERNKFPEPKVEQRTLAALVADLRTAPTTRTFDPLFAHYSTFKKALEKTGLINLLRDNDKRFIVFAPDDLAFEQLRMPFKDANSIETFISGSIDVNGNPVQPQYNDSILLRTILLNHIVEIPNNADFDVNSQRTFGSLAAQPSSFLPANNPLNTPWINNSITITPSRGVQGKLDFVPPAVNGAPMFSWGTQASNGVLNTVSAVLFPATAYEFIKKDGRHNDFATMVDYNTDVVAYLSNPTADITVFPSRLTAALPNIPSTKTRIQHHILAPSLGRLSNLNASGAVRFVPNLNAGRLTGILLASTGTCVGTATVVAIQNDPTSTVPGITVVGYPGLAAYGLGNSTCVPPSGLLGFIAVSNGLVYGTSTLLNE
jgi:uncharacterized surface protein with fasciclin (FAS1) repeats